MRPTEKGSVVSGAASTVAPSPGWRLHPAMASGFVLPCIPTRAAKPPAGPDWIHEIKHDGYRLQVRRDGDTVRLFTRNG
jgi:ATP-dependent DNA ligase